MSLQPWLEIITDGFLALDKDLKITYVNHAAGKILSTSTDLLIGKELVDLTQDEFFQRCLDECQNALTRKKQRSVTIDYGPKSLELNVFPAEEHLNVLVKDSSERVFASEKLSASEELFATAFTASPIPMLIIGLEDGELVEVNKSFQDLTGYSRNQLVGKTSKLVNVDLDGPKNFNLRERICKEHSIDNYEVEFVTSTGENRVGLYTFNLIKGGNEEQILAACTDITRFRRMQMEMARLDRLDLIGVLAAGLGHEIRNPLTTVRGFLQLLGNKDSSTESREYFELMISELDRANDIITEFLSLARVNPISLERRNLNEVIKRLYPLIHSDGISRDKAIELKLNPVPDLNINVKEISQLILNMVRNGLDAMEEYGVLTIETRTTGKHVVLSIKDQGCGISKEFIAKLGTPFFTTKANGTGLGLAVCYGIAERHNATIEVKSGAEGTVFSISFPVDQANSNQG